jgi:hypothetical protein
MAFLKPVSKREAPNYYESKLILLYLLRILLGQPRVTSVTACSDSSPRKVMVIWHIRQPFLAWHDQPPHRCGIGFYGTGS